MIDTDTCDNVLYLKFRLVGVAIQWRLTVIIITAVKSIHDKQSTNH